MKNSVKNTSNGWNLHRPTPSQLSTKRVVNKVVDALSRRNLMVQSIELESVGISVMKEMCPND